MAKLFAGWPRGRVLDLAAGRGAFARRLLGLGFSVEACDLDEAQFKAPEIPYKSADLSKPLPYGDAEFDYLSCIEAIEHLEDQFSFVRECYRVLRPGGRLVVTTPNVLNLASRWQYYWTGFFPLAPRPLNEFSAHALRDHIHPISYYELRYILRTSGFLIEGVGTNRYRRAAIAQIWAYPMVWLATRRGLRKEPKSNQREANRQIASHMLSRALLFGRNLIVTAAKPA